MNTAVPSSRNAKLYLYSTFLHDGAQSTTDGALRSLPSQNLSRTRLALPSLKPTNYADLHLFI